MEALDRTILIVEDDEGLQSQLKWHFDDFESTLITAHDRTEALNAVRMYSPSIIIQDLGLPPDDEGVSEGFACIRDILTIAPDSKIIVMTGKNDHKNALDSIAAGAFDFYLKPVDPERLSLVVDQAFRIARLEHENRSQQTFFEPIAGLVTADATMKRVCRMAEKIAQSPVTSTLLGESGTGKEVLARAIHNMSDRKDRPFVAINCAAVPENLIESELFGFEKGAFTGAGKTTEGRIEQANSGTLFLDEIGDMPLPLQAKLLRFLQERVIERVGGRKAINIDARVICATNKDLKTMVAEGKFREDLYYRICEIVVDIPPLRNRGTDARLLANFFLQKYSRSMKQRSMRFSDDALSGIDAYEWPGNIREVENRVKRAVVLAENHILSAEDLDLKSDSDGLLNLNLRKIRQSAEVEAIEQALALSDYNVSMAAKMLGVTRPTLYDLIKKYALNTDKKTEEDSL